MEKGCLRSGKQLHPSGLLPTHRTFEYGLPLPKVILLITKKTIEDKKAIQTASKLLYPRVKAPHGRPHHIKMFFFIFP